MSELYESFVRWAIKYHPPEDTFMDFVRWYHNLPGARDYDISDSPMPEMRKEQIGEVLQWAKRKNLC